MAIQIKNTRIPAKVYNTDINLYCLSEDRLKSRIQENVPTKKGFVRLSLDYASIPLTLMITLLTASFKDIYCLKADVWKIFVVLLLIMSILVCIYELCDNYKMSEVQELVDDILEDSYTTDEKGNERKYKRKTKKRKKK